MRPSYTVDEAFNYLLRVKKSFQFILKIETTRWTMYPANLSICRLRIVFYKNCIYIISQTVARRATPRWCRVFVLGPRFGYKRKFCGSFNPITAIRILSGDKTAYIMNVKEYELRGVYNWVKKYG